MEYDNTNRGALWGNDRKETDKHPDFRGSINVDGKEYWLSGWKRKPDDNPKAPALSLSVQAKDEVQQQGYQQASQQATPPPQEDFGDDIPFAPIRKGYMVI